MVFKYYSWYCVNGNLLHTTTILFHAWMSRFTHWMFHFKGFCVNFNSLNVPLFVMNNKNVSTYIGTVHQNWQCFDISRGLGDRVRLRLITEGDRELVPHVCSYHMIKYWHSIGSGLSRDYLRDRKMCHVIRWGALYSLFTFWCSFIFGIGILL